MKYVLDRINYLKSRLEWLKNSVAAAPEFIEKYSVCYGTAEADSKKLAGQKMETEEIKAELIELKKVKNTQKCPWTSDRILITSSHSDAIEFYDVINKAGETEPGGADFVPACTVMVIVGGKTKESTIIKHRRDLIPAKPNYKEIKKQVSIFKKDYPTLGIQDNIKRKGLNYDY